MSQRPGDLGSFILAGHSPSEAARLASEYEQKKRNGNPLAPPPKQEPTNPVSEVEALTGTRMTKGQKWAWVIGITLALYGVTIYLNKK